MTQLIKAPLWHLLWQDRCKQKHRLIYDRFPWDDHADQLRKARRDIRGLGSIIELKATSGYRPNPFLAANR